MKNLFFALLACLMIGCTNHTKEEKVDAEPLGATKKEISEIKENKPALSKEDSIRLKTRLPPKIIPQDRDIVDLLQDSDSVVVIAHERLWEANTVGDSAKAIREKVTLTHEQRILFVKTLNKNTRITIKQVKEACWYPHHKVYFYTKQGIAYWEICFRCKNERSKGISFLNASNINLGQNGVIAKLFKKFGLTYEL